MSLTSKSCSSCSLNGILLVLLTIVATPIRKNIIFPVMNYFVSKNMQHLIIQKTPEKNYTKPNLPIISECLLRMGIAKRHLRFAPQPFSTSIISAILITSPLPATCSASFSRLQDIWPLNVFPFLRKV